MATRRSRLAWAAASTTVATGLLIGPFGLVAAAAVPSLVRGERGLSRASEAARAGDDRCAAVLFSGAARRFDTARRLLGGWASRPVRVLPWIGARAVASEALAGAGATAATAGAEAVRVGRRTGGSRGTVDLPALGRLRAALARAARAGREGRQALSTLRPPPGIPPRQAVDRVAGRLTEAAKQVGDAMEVVDTATAMVGGNGPRRYFVAVLNPSEQRASGGIVGDYAVLTADGGRLSLERVGRNEDFVGDSAAAVAALGPVGPADYRARYRGIGPERFFLNAPLSPDFPTVAHVIEALYPRFGGRPVDGVIAVDPIALAAVLALTGPVAVPGWPEPLTAANAAPVLLHEQYVRLEGDGREQFLLGVVGAVFDRLASMPAPSPASVLQALIPAVRGRHLVLHSTRPREQRVLERAGAAGAIAPVQGDFLQVVTQNGGQNKIDWFQHRSVSYRAAYEPATGLVRSTVRVRLENRAPAGGLPPYVIGGPGFPVARGHSRSWVSVYSPLGLDGATLDGRPVGVSAEGELGRRVFSLFADVGPGAAATLELHLSGRLAPGSVYRLDVGHQPTIAPDRLAVSVVVPDGWWVRPGSGLDVDAHRAVGRLDQTADSTFVARLERRRPPLPTAPPARYRKHPEGRPCAAA